MRFLVRHALVLHAVTMPDHGLLTIAYLDDSE
jgi:hypothetical protein